ncbi:unnamed protein product [Prorocentrum cordatum]|uniref:Uncharacterized protein n=1 Tax=Prorocentrum cordatum TaxID=2364126 RepID=A0ABN9XSZ9_9DINO|nr:unnamed protein product [Polarella glacialis]
MGKYGKWWGRRKPGKYGPAEGADAPGPLAQSRSEGRLAGALPLGAGGSERRPSSESLVSPLPRRKPAQLRGGPLDAAAPGPRGPALSPATSGTGTPPFGAASPTSLTGNSADSSPTASRGPRPWDAAACGAFAPRFLRSKGRGAPATLQALPGTPQRGAGEPAAGGADESPLAHADWSSVRRGEQDQDRGRRLSARRRARGPRPRWARRPSPRRARGRAAAGGRAPASQRW